MTMSAAYISSRIAKALLERGSTVTLQRRQGLTAIFTEVTVPATVRDFQPTESVRISEVPGDRASDDILVTVSFEHLAGWPVPPQKGDFLVYSGRSYAVLGAEEKEVSNLAVAYRIHCRGG